MGTKLDLESVTVRGGNRTFSFLFDMGAAMTCMNKKSIEMAFGSNYQRIISEALSCIANSGNAMN
jgi:hypothetical protein